MRAPAARIEERVVDSGTEKFSGFSQGKTSSWAISDTSPGIGQAEVADRADDAERHDQARADDRGRRRVLARAGLRAAR